MTGYALKKPCSNCPFRSDKLFPLPPDRVLEIAESQGGFKCHKTVDYSGDDGYGRNTPKSQECAGRMIMLMKMEQPDQMMRIAGRLGMFDPDQLDMDAPVWDDVDDYLDALAERGIE